MNWFYAKDGQQAGPVDDTELTRLVSTGDIADSTLVWHSGLPNWQPYAAVAQAGAEAGGTATLAAVAAGTVRPGPGQAQCSQCGRVLPADEVVRIENMDVCAECKPGFLQRLREGAAVGGVTYAPTYAGFWIRFGAAVLDGIILIPFYLLIGVGFFFLTDLHNLDYTHGVQPQEIARITRGFLPFNLAIQFLLACYSAFCINRFGGTPGKRICGLRVVHGTAGGRVSFLRGLGRFAAKMVPRAIPGLLAGYLPPALLTPLVYIYPITDSLFIVFDGQKRALHDMICDTRVLIEKP